MFGKITHNNKEYSIDFDKPIDISIPLRQGKENVNAWYVDPPKFEPVRMGDWIGDVKQGGSVNFNNVFINPHGHGTHTECVGHISKEDFTINQCLKKFFFIAELVSILPEEQANGDQLITQQHLATVLGDNRPEAIVIRTIPNAPEKLNHQYSDTNPPYIEEAGALWLREIGIQHLLIDLPSVDAEKDDGKLVSHHAFWNYPEAPRTECTISEMIYVPNEVIDGTFLLNFQIASFELDASPSKPTLYTIR